MGVPKKRLIQLLNRYLHLNNNDIESRYKETTGDETLNLLHDLHEIRALDPDEILDKLMECCEHIKGYEAKTGLGLFRDYLEMQSMIRCWLATKEQQFMHDHTTNPFRVYEKDENEQDEEQEDEIPNKVDFAKIGRFKTAILAATKDYDLLIHLIHNDALHFPKVCDLAEEYYSNH